MAVGGDFRCGGVVGCNHQSSSIRPKGFGSQPAVGFLGERIVTTKKGGSVRPAKQPDPGGRRAGCSWLPDPRRCEFSSTRTQHPEIDPHTSQLSQDSHVLLRSSERRRSAPSRVIDPKKAGGGGGHRLFTKRTRAIKGKEGKQNRGALVCPAFDWLTSVLLASIRVFFHHPTIGMPVTAVIAKPCSRACLRQHTYS